MMNKKNIFLFILIFFKSVLVQADGSEVEYYLKKHYLSQFVEPESDNDIFDAPPVEDSDYEFELFSLSERITPWRIRIILLQFICPQCYGKPYRPDPYPVHFHTDIWRDMQVFGVGNKAHIYDAAFPGAGRLGEIYGAYQLVAGATYDVSQLVLRQFLIQQIRQRNIKDEFGKELKAIDEHLARGVAIFDKLHPLSRLSELDIYSEEQKYLDWFNNVYLKNKKSITAEEYEKNVVRAIVVNNMKGVSTQRYVRFTYWSAVSLVLFLGANFKMNNRARTLDLAPWNNCQNCLQNMGRSVTKLGSYASVVTAPLALYRAAGTISQSHSNYKQINRVLTHELIALKPFLETLFAFSDVRGLPVNFALDENELALSASLLDKIGSLDTYDGFFFQQNLVKAASAARILLALKDTIARFLVNIAMLDFYVAVAEGSKDSDLWNFAKYDVHGYYEILPTPKIFAKKLWNPILAPHQAVPSDVQLGKRQPDNIILTGPNASGKSTFLRSLGINTIFMAQNLGVVAAKEFEFRPFTHFDSLMEKRDAKGRSSFETEAAAVLRSWNHNKALEKGHRSLILADELFRTTPAKEGAKTSKLLVQKLGQLPHVAMVVSTHFKSMNKLAEKYPKTFTSKHMSVEVDETTKEVIRNNYWLTNGPSPVTNAQQLFKEKFREKHPQFFKHSTVENL